MKKFSLFSLLFALSLLSRARQNDWSILQFDYFGIEDEFPVEYTAVSDPIIIDGFVCRVIDTEHPNGLPYGKGDDEWQTYIHSHHTFECVVIDYIGNTEELYSIDIPEQIAIDYYLERGSVLFEPCHGNNHPDGLHHELLSVTGIADYTFADCSNLSSVKLPSTIRSIGFEAFRGCRNIPSINVENVTMFCGLSFKDCSSLTSISFSNNLRYLGDSFVNCTSLSSPITLPSSLVLCPSFTNCSSLPSVDMSAVYFDYAIVDGSVAGFSGCSSLTSIKLPPNTRKIRENCFEGCSSLTSLEIPETVETIEKGAFWGCSSLESITIPQKVSCYDEYGIIRCPFNFKGCNSLKKITFNCPSVIWEVDSVQVEEVFLGENVQHISASSFIDKTHLNSLQVSSDNPYYDSRSGCKAIIDSHTNILLVGSNQTVISEGVVAIGDSAFWGKTSLKEISFPKSLTYIGKYSFNNCAKLSSITIPQWIETIETSLFGSFRGCISLKSVFIDTPEVKQWFFLETADSIQEVVLGEHVKEIGSAAFLGFRNVASFDIHEGITSIGYAAFEYCLSLKSILLPSTIESIQREAFYNCYNLDSIISQIQEPFPLEEMTFDVAKAYYTDEYGERIITRNSDYLYKNAILCVPKGTKGKYESTQGWNRFQHIVEMETPATVNGLLSKASSKDAIYDIGGRSMKKMHSGINILQDADGSIRKVLVK